MFHFQIVTDYMQRMNIKIHKTNRFEIEQTTREIMFSGQNLNRSKQRINKILYQE